MADHPRSRGEYQPPVYIGLRTQGSSPLSRGILTYWKFKELNVGIIPALAGNTLDYQQG